MDDSDQLFERYVPLDLQKEAIAGARDPGRNPQGLTPREWADEHLLRDRIEFEEAMRQVAD